MSDHQTPPVPPDADLKDFPFTPIYRARLFGSSFHARASDAEWRAGVTLWLKSQDQSPAGSLPDDDVELCRLAELGRDVKTWRKLREGALHGWFKCDDGRLYNKVVAEVVNEQWTGRVKQRERKEEWREKKRRQREGQMRDAEGKSPSMSPGTKQNVPRENALKGEGKGQGEGYPLTPETFSSSVNGTGVLKAIGRDWKPDAETLQFAALGGIADAELARQAQMFRDHHIGKGTMAADFDALFRKWLSRRGQFETPRDSQAKPPAKQPYIP